jgi:hypothetical protein
MVYLLRVGFSKNKKGDQVILTRLSFAKSAGAEVSLITPAGLLNTSGLRP